MMVTKELYKKEPTTIKYFEAVDQSMDIIANLFAECDDDEIISYLCRIKGFKDYEAAQEFVILIEQRPKVLVNTEVYDYTHPMLIDQYLKRRYTKARNLLIKK